MSAEGSAVHFVGRKFSTGESFAGVPPHFFFNEIASFGSSSRPYLPKYAMPHATPTSSFDCPFRKQENI